MGGKDGRGWIVGKNEWTAEQAAKLVENERKAPEERAVNASCSNKICSSAVEREEEEKGTRARVCTADIKVWSDCSVWWCAHSMLGWVVRADGHTTASGTGARPARPGIATFNWVQVTDGSA